MYSLGGLNAKSLKVASMVSVYIGLISPLLFAVYMDVLIKRLRDAGFGCKLAEKFFGCLLYADDIVLLAHSLNAIRQMLRICEEFASDFDMKFNSSKSVAMRIGDRFKVKCEPLILDGSELQFVESMKYLGGTVCSS